MKRCLNCMEIHESIYEVCPYCGFVEGLYREDPIDLTPGTKIADRYIIGTQIAKGGFSITYTGWDTLLHAKVAIKEYYPHGKVERNITTKSIVSINDDFKAAVDLGLDSFLNEAKIMAQFNNEPGIVHVYDFLKENGTAYIVMEFIDGQTLNDYIGVRGIGNDEALEIVVNIAKTLSKLHKADVIHQDISLENIMVSNDGQIKILDFGAAEDTDLDVYDKDGVVLKHSYAPLEQYSNNSKCDERTDIYALGAVMYHMMTGQVPVSAIDRKINDTLRKPKDINKDIPEWMNDVILKCMEMSPEDRFRDTSYVIRAIEKKEPIKKDSTISKRGIIIIIAIFICMLGVFCFNSLSSKGEAFIPEEKNADTIKLVDSTFSCRQWDDGSWTFTPILLVENNSENKVLTQLYVEIDAKNSEGNSIYKESYSIGTFVAPGTQNVVAENVEASEEIVSVDYELVADKHTLTNMESLNHSTFVPLEGDIVSGTEPVNVKVINNNNYDLKFVQVCVLHRDESGKLIGGDYNWFEHIPANSEDIHEAYIKLGYDNEIYIIPSIDEMM